VAGTQRQTLSSSSAAHSKLLQSVTLAEECRLRVTVAEEGR